MNVKSAIFNVKQDPPVFAPVNLIYSQPLIHLNEILVGKVQREFGEYNLQMNSNDEYSSRSWIENLQVKAILLLDRQVL